jgi:hypothetical protein
MILPFQPTFSYPRIRWTPQGTSTAILLDLAEQATEHSASTTSQRSTNIVQGGKGEYLFARNEEIQRVAFFFEDADYMALRTFFETHGGLGRPFELWVDRYQGSVWHFEWSLADQNGLTWSPVGFTPSVASYEWAFRGRGIRLATSQYLTMNSVQSTATPNRTGYDDPLIKEEGIVVVDCKPSFPSGDGVQHSFFQAYTSPDTGKNAIYFFKDTSNFLNWYFFDAAGVDKRRFAAAVWNTNERLTLVGRWTATGDLSAWFSVNGASFQEFTGAAGAGTGILSTQPATLDVGGTAEGLYDSLAIFKFAWPNDAPYRVLANHFPAYRNYWPYAELVTNEFNPQRVYKTRHLWSWSPLIRNGAA